MYLIIWFQIDSFNWILNKQKRVVQGIFQHHNHLSGFSKQQVFLQSWFPVDIKASCELIELNVQATFYLSCEVWCKQIFTWCLSIMIMTIIKGILAKATNHNPWSIIQSLKLYNMYLQVWSCSSHSQTSYIPIWSSWNLNLFWDL